MRMVTRDGHAFRLGEALLWSFVWGLGAAAGVALGAWLTVAGASGVLGSAAVDPAVDVVRSALAAFCAVVLVHLSAQVVAALVRAHRASRDATHHGRQPIR